MSKNRLWVLVPVKRFDEAKSRLRSVLDVRERAELARGMLEDVLATLAACPGILSGVLVVTADEEVAATARRFDARVLPQPEDRGINAAILHALESAAADDGVIVVPSDIPQLTRAAIARTAAAIENPHSMAIVSADDGGTNLLACRPANLLAPRFGPDSFEIHRRAAMDAGISVHTLDLPELALDIDQPQHIEKFLAMQTNTRTHAFLSRRVIAGVVS